jgi:pimeloyl-ACP methyl ester carboxylesterase
LFLGFNDGFVTCDRSGLDGGGVGDNNGSFSATITITSNPPVPVPVVLVHGFCGSPLSFGNMKSLLETKLALAPDMVVAFDYSDGSEIAPSRRIDIPRLAGLFAEFVRGHFPGTQVDVVTHSMGGLIARAWIVGLALDEQLNAVQYDGEIRHLVMAGTPHYGAKLASWSDLFDGLPNALKIANCGDDDVRNSQAIQLQFGSSFVKLLHDKWQKQTEEETLEIAPENLLSIVGCGNFIFSKGSCETDRVVDAAAAVLPISLGNQYVRYVAYDHATAPPIPKLPGRTVPWVGIVDVRTEDHATFQFAESFLSGQLLAQEGYPLSFDGMILLIATESGGIPYTQKLTSTAKCEKSTSNAVPPPPGANTGMFTFNHTAPKKNTNIPWNCEVTIKPAKNYMPVKLSVEVLPGHPTAIEFEIQKLK